MSLFQCLNSIFNPSVFLSLEITWILVDDLFGGAQRWLLSSEQAGHTDIIALGGKIIPLHTHSFISFPSVSQQHCQLALIMVLIMVWTPVHQKEGWEQLCSHFTKLVEQLSNGNDFQSLLALSVLQQVAKRWNSIYAIICFLSYLTLGFHSCFYIPQYFSLQWGLAAIMSMNLCHVFLLSVKTFQIWINLYFSTLQEDKMVDT